MEREIKFRAWDSREGLNKMYWGISWKRYGEGFEGGNPEYKFYQIFHGKEGFSCTDEKSLRLMQYTGMDDKNGREIYEGDVIRRRGQPNTWVEYGKCKWVIRHDSPKAEWRQDLCNFTPLHLEVIGNIYENPELLTKP